MYISFTVGQRKLRLRHKGFADIKEFEDHFSNEYALDVGTPARCSAWSVIWLTEKDHTEAGSEGSLVP